MHVLFGILGGNFLTGNPSQQRVAAADEKRPSGRYKPEARSRVCGTHGRLWAGQLPRQPLRWQSQGPVAEACSRCAALRRLSGEPHPEFRESIAQREPRGWPRP